MHTRHKCLCFQVCVYRLLIYTNGNTWNLEFASLFPYFAQYFGISTGTELPHSFQAHLAFPLRRCRRQGVYFCSVGIWGLQKQHEQISLDRRRTRLKTLEPALPMLVITQKPRLGAVGEMTRKLNPAPHSQSEGPGHLGKVSLMPESPTLERSRASYLATQGCSTIPWKLVLLSPCFLQLTLRLSLISPHDLD